MLSEIALNKGLLLIGSKPGCGRNNSGSNPGILPILFIKYEPRMEIGPSPNPGDKRVRKQEREKDYCVGRDCIKRMTVSILTLHYVLKL